MIYELRCEASILLVSGGAYEFYTQSELDTKCFITPYISGAFVGLVGAGAGVASTFLLVEIIGIWAAGTITAALSGAIGIATYANHVGQHNACSAKPGYYNFAA